MKFKLQSLLTLLLILSIPLLVSAQSDENIIVNGDFSSGELAPWSTFIADFAGANASVSVANGMANVAINNVSGEASWHVQLNQVFSEDQRNALEVGTYYRISFDASAVADRSVNVYFGEDGGSFTALSLKTISLPEGDSSHEIYVLVNQKFNNMKLGFEFGLSNVDASITNVSLIQSDPNVLVNGDFASGELAPWSTYLADWAGANANITVSEGSVMIDNITTGGSDSWHIQLNQVLSEEQMDRLVIGGTYVLSFDANASAARTVNVYFGEDGGSFRALAVQTLSLPAGESTKTMVATVTDKFENMKLGFEFGLSNVSVSLSNISLIRDDSAAIEPGGEEVIPAEVEMPENFILFAAGGRHVTIPGFLHGNVINDATINDVPVIRFDYGNWNIGGFDWGTAGIDISERRAAQDSIFIRIWSSPNNLTSNREVSGNNTPKIMFLDMPPPGNLEFRTQLALPDEVHVGRWVDIAIPLPAYLTKTELENAKSNGTLTGYAALWDYWGAYSPARQEVISDVEDRDWREFSWERVRRFGIYWDQNNPPNAPIYIEHIYIGRSNLDLSIATEGPGSMSSISAVSDGDINRLSWSTRDDIFSYGIYYSSQPITDVTDPKVRLWGTVPANVTEIEHEVYRAHPSIENRTYYYAVAPGNAWGMLSQDVSGSSASITTKGKDKGYIFQLTAAEEDGVFNALDSGSFPGINSFPTDRFSPVQLRFPDEPNQFWTGPEDSQGDVWVAYGTSGGFTTLFFYGEIMDDDVLGGPVGNLAGMTGTTIYPRCCVGDFEATTWVPGITDTNLEWNYYLKDQLEIQFGAYTTDDYIVGSPNMYRSRGATPEYVLAFQPHFVNTGTVDIINEDPTGLLVRLWITEPSGESLLDYRTLYYNSNHPLTTPAVYENIYDDNDNRIGWKFFAAVDSQDLLVVTEGGTPVDTEMTLPGAAELAYMPMTMVLWDKDGGLAPATGGWWETATSVIQFPSKPWGQSTAVNSSNISGLGALAVAGREVSTSVEESDLPRTAQLYQNYPNPFNPTTNIEFQLPEASAVRLTIYNSIGQQVATLLNGSLYQAGRHTVNFDARTLSSGIYFYRLDTGKQIFQRKMILIK
jgi:hypothetical protein